MSSYSLRRGFTLIELLVVIAVIGILASVVLAALNGARQKGQAAAVKNSLSNARVQAELFYDANNYSYNGVCNAGAVNGVSSALTLAQKALEITDSAATVSTGGQNITTRRGICHDSSTKYVISIPTSKTSNTFWCIDSTGVSLAHTVTVNSSSTLDCNTVSGN